MEYKKHTHVKFNIRRDGTTDIPYRFRVHSYLTTQEWEKLSDDEKIHCNEIRECDFAIIDQIIADLPNINR